MRSIARYHGFIAIRSVFKYSAWPGPGCAMNTMNPGAIYLHRQHSRQHNRIPFRSIWFGPHTNTQGMTCKPPRANDERTNSPRARANLTHPKIVPLLTERIWNARTRCVTNTTRCTRRDQAGCSECGCVCGPGFQGSPFKRTHALRVHWNCIPAGFARPWRGETKCNPEPAVWKIAPSSRCFGYLFYAFSTLSCSLSLSLSLSATVPIQPCCTVCLC